VKGPTKGEKKKKQSATGGDQVENMGQTFTTPENKKKKQRKFPQKGPEGTISQPEGGAHKERTVGGGGGGGGWGGGGGGGGGSV